MIIGVDLRVLASGQHSGVEEYTEQVVRHMVALDRTIQWRLISLGMRGVAWRSWFDHPSVRRVHLGIPSSIAWSSTILAGGPLLDRGAGGLDVMFFPHMILGAVSPLCPVVSTWHDMSYAMMPELLSPRQRLWHNVQMMPRWQAQRARHIIAVSQSTADDVIACYGVNFERVSVVYSGIDSSLKRPSKEDIALYRRQSMLPDSFILALGTVEPRKNIETLVGAFERIAERVSCDLVVVGSPGWQWEWLMMRIARSPVRSRIHVRGAVHPGERALLIGAANVVAYPSYLEGFGFPPLEALACGVPVVASHSSSIAEVAGQWAVLVDPYREDSVARGLVYALEDMKLRDSVQGVAHTIRATYSWEIAAQKTLEILTRSMVY